MKNSTILGLALKFLVALLLTPPAWAQAYPTKPMKIVVPFGPGGVADLTARTVAQKLSQSMGQPVVIENKPGAGGIAASDLVAKSEPDGHTMLLMSNGSAVTANLFKTLPFDMVRDFTPASTLGFFDIAIVTATGSRFKTLEELLDYARKNPGKLNLGSVNIGSTQNLAAELFKSNAGVDMQIVPFNGTPALVNALRGGQIDAAVEILAPVIGQIKGGALQALAVTSEKRSALLPMVPTAKESGLPDYVATSWNALAVPSTTPKEVVDKLNQQIIAAVNSPEVRNRLAELGVDAKASSSKQAQEFLVSEIKRWGEVIQRANIPKQ